MLINWPKEVKPYLNFPHRLNTYLFYLIFYWIKLFAHNFQRRISNISSQHVLGLIFVDSFSAEIHE